MSRYFGAAPVTARAIPALLCSTSMYSDPETKGSI